MGGFDYELRCPQCGAAFRAPRVREGAREPCPVCGASVRVGEPEAEGLVAAEAHDEEPVSEREVEPLRAGTVLASGGGPMVVCCVREQKVNPLDVAPLVERFSGLRRVEAGLQVTRGMGVLGEGLSPDGAREMIAELGRLDVEAFAIPMASEPPVADEVKIEYIHGLDEAAVYVQEEPTGPVKAVPWANVAGGLCVMQRYGQPAEVEEIVEDRPMVVSGGSLPAMGWQRMRRMKRHPERPTRDIMLLLRDPKGRAYPMPFVERQVRYGYLGQRLRAASSENLGLFLQDVIRWGSPAFFPEGFRAAARGEMFRVTRLLGKLARKNYIRWVLCCAAAQGLFDVG